MVSAPECLGHEERNLITAAVLRVKKLLPGPIGLYMARDLLSMSTMGFRLDGTGLTRRTVDAILSAPLPAEDV